MVASLLVVSDHRMVVDVVSADVILVVGGRERRLTSDIPRIFVLRDLESNLDTWSESRKEPR